MCKVERQNESWLVTRLCVKKKGMVFSQEKQSDFCQEGFPPHHPHTVSAQLGLSYFLDFHVPPALLSSAFWMLVFHFLFCSHGPVLVPGRAFQHSLTHGAHKFKS